MHIQWMFFVVLDPVLDLFFDCSCSGFGAVLAFCFSLCVHQLGSQPEIIRKSH